MIRSTIARGVAALALLSLAASPALADITVKDGAGASQTLRTFVYSGVHTYGFAPIDTTGAQVNPATSNLQQSMLNALGAPYQAGGPLPLPAGAAAAANQLGNIAFAGTTSPLAASATFTGAARDTGVASGVGGIYAYFNGVFLADQAGTAYIDGSDDNATWVAETPATAVAANTPTLLTVPVAFRYHRIRYVNGSTAQGSFVAKSSYTAG